MFRRRKGAVGRLALCIAAGLAGAAALAGPPEAARRAELAELLRHDCGACHGLTLKGGLGPALTREALAGKPRALLRATILHGRPGTAMPPWAGLLSETDVDWLLERLERGPADEVD